MTTTLNNEKAKEAYYATHDFGRRLICVDVPDPVYTTVLCGSGGNDRLADDSGDEPSFGGNAVLVDGVVDLCETETQVLNDLRALQSRVGAPGFMHTPW